jgi:hypothetical protein
MGRFDLMRRFDCTMYVTNLYFLFDFVVVLLGFHFFSAFILFSQYNTRHPSLIRPLLLSDQF